MNNEAKTNNKVYLSGTIESEPVFSHELYGEGFYEFTLRVPRLRLLGEKNLVKGTKISFYGQFRSFNKLVGEKSKLMLTVFVRDFLDEDEEANPNVTELTGYVCKQPMYRTTPFNREICDLLIAVNRAYDKSDYIPCIAWGRNARFVKEMAVGQKLSLSGRIQSREYTKKLPDGSSEIRVAYELSVNKIFMEEE